MVLDRVDDRWQERLRMSEALYRHSLANDTVIAALPIGEEEFERPGRRVVLNARAEGVPIG